VKGELGDCWLLAAMANMAMNKRVRAKVVPLDQSFAHEYAGIFHFRSGLSVSWNQCFGSGSMWIHIEIASLDPDPGQSKLHPNREKM